MTLLRFMSVFVMGLIPVLAISGTFKDSSQKTLGFLGR